MPGKKNSGCKNIEKQKCGRLLKFNFFLNFETLNFRSFFRQHFYPSPNLIQRPSQTKTQLSPNSLDVCCFAFTSRLYCDLHFSQTQSDSLSKESLETMKPPQFLHRKLEPYVEFSVGSLHRLQSHSNIFVCFKCRLLTKVVFKVSV